MWTTPFNSDWLRMMLDVWTWREDTDPASNESRACLEVVKNQVTMAFRRQSIARCNPWPLVIILTLAGCAGTGPAGLGGEKSDTAETRGRAIALSAFSTCHDVQGTAQGTGRKAPGFADPGFRHTVALPGRLAILTQKGHYDMPARLLTTQQISDLLAYIGRNDEKE